MYGPSPYTARWKWPSGHLTMSGVVIPALRGSKTRARQVWYIWQQKTWYFGFFRCFLVASIIGSLLYLPQNLRGLLLGIGRNATGSRALLWALQATLVRFPGDIYTGWYSWWPVATDTVVLSLPATMGTNIAPWVNSSSAILSYITCRISWLNM